MPVRKHEKRSAFMRMTKKELIREIEKWRAMYTASLEQLDQVQYTEVELESYKGYLKESRERLIKVRKERDLALELLALRLS